MNTSEKGVLIVLPALNEAATLKTVISEINEFAPHIDCLVVNDGSSDQTAHVALASGAMLLDLPFNIGVGGAMRAGFRFALQSGYKTVVQVDSDGQHDPKNIRELLDALHESDLVIGARFAGRGDYQVHGLRKIAMKCLSWILSRLAKTKLTDTTSGFRAFGQRAVLVFADDFPAEYLGDTVEALVIASRSGLAISQVPVQMRERQGGVPSQNPVKSALYLGRVFMVLAIALIRPVNKSKSEA